jgi:hypothetical protein
MSADDERLDESTPAERLRALELSGDPDARRIARMYKSGPLEQTKPLMRQIARSSARLGGVFRATYAQATEADADEAEEKVAEMRAEREAVRRARERQLHEFAERADKREKSMLRLTWASVVVALVSLGIAVAALLVAISTAS